jgi:tRNA threonylcarbamoyl adenosine modification protein (Sua5/YciO/YrdC/YwlC family)
METFKIVAGIVAITLTFVAYVPYFRDIFRGKTEPHVFSWLIWGIVTTIIFFLQMSDGAGFGALVTLAVAVIGFIIFFLALKKGNKNISSLDVIFLVLALLAIPLWLFIDQPVLAIILLSTIDMLGFAPTVRKSWQKPYSETLSLYTITIVRHALSVVALAHYSIITLAFPLTWVFANALFALMLMIRRRVVIKNPFTQSGQVAILLTDTLYGLVAKVDDQEAVEKVYSLKGRDFTKPCIVLAADKEAIGEYGSLVEEVSKKYDGAVTVVVPKTTEPEWITRGGTTVAYRILKKTKMNKKLKELLQQTGPLIAPSANPQGLMPAKGIEEAREYFGSAVDVYIDGGTVPDDTQPSKIIEMLSDGTEKVRR